MVRDREPPNSTGGATGGPGLGSTQPPPKPTGTGTGAGSGTSRRGSARYPSLSIPLWRIEDDTHDTLDRSQGQNDDTQATDFDDGLDDEDREMLGGGRGNAFTNKPPTDRRNRTRTDDEVRDDARRESVLQFHPQVLTELSLRFDEDTNAAILWFCRIHEEEEEREELIADIRDKESFLEEVQKRPAAFMWHLIHALNNENTALNDKEEAERERDIAIHNNDMLTEHANEIGQQLTGLSEQLEESNRKLTNVTAVKNRYRADLVKLQTDCQKLEQQLRSRGGPATGLDDEDARYLDRQFPSSPPLPNLNLDNPGVRFGGATNLETGAPFHSDSARSHLSGGSSTGAERYRHIDTFKGSSEDRDYYKAWKTSALSYLRKNPSIHPTHTDQIEYVLTHTRGAAFNLIEHRATEGTRGGYMSVMELFEDLDRVYLSADPVGDAMSKLHSGELKMKWNEKFDTWVGRYISTVAPLVLKDYELVTNALRLMDDKFNRDTGAATAYRMGDSWNTFVSNVRHSATMNKIAFTEIGNRFSNNTQNKSGGRSGSAAGNNNSATIFPRHWGRTKPQQDAMNNLGLCFKCGVAGHRSVDKDAPCRGKAATPADRITALRATLNVAAMDASSNENNDDGTHHRIAELPNQGN